MELGKDIEIKVTGLRPGEKLYEELLAEEENTIPTHHPQILKAKVRHEDAQQITEIEQLIQLFERQENDQIVGKMKHIVPELDVLGHVNNNIYLSYFEMARVHYFRELLGISWDWQKFGIVIAKNEVEYVKSVLLQHEPQITVFTEQLGTKSFTLGYELRVNDEVYAKGRSVQVCFDATTQSTIAIPDQMRFALEKIIKE